MIGQIIKKMDNSIDPECRHIKLLISLFLTMAVIIAYWQVKDFGFVYFDDNLYITDNRYVQEGLTAKGLVWAFTTYHAANWHPLTWLSHMLDCELYGLNPMGHHWTNLQFHIANSLLLFFILQKMTGVIWRSGFVAALFALHPLHVESVAWIAERKDVLSTFFGLLTILAYHYYVKQPRVIIYLLVILFFGLGLMAKPMLVTFPFLLLLLDYWPLKRFQYNNNRAHSNSLWCFDFHKFLRLFLEKVPLLFLSVISSGVTIIAQKGMNALPPLEFYSLSVRIENTFVTYINYLIKTIWPQSLSVYYPHPGDTLLLWQVFSAIMLIAGISILATYTIKQYPYLAVGWFWYIGSLVPVIGLVQVGGQAMADRYTYIPLIGIFIMVAWGIPAFLVHWRYRTIFSAIFAIIILLTLTARTSIQVGHWKNKITLFENAMRINYNSSLIHRHLATAFIEAGNVDRAIFHYYEVLAIEPENLAAHNNLANIYFAREKFEKSIFHYKEALRNSPDCEVAHYNLGMLLVKQGKIKNGVLHLLEAVKIKPDFAQAYNEIGMILARQGDYKKACIFFSRAILERPDFSKAKINFEKYLKLCPPDRKASGNNGVIDFN